MSEPVSEFQIAKERGLEPALEDSQPAREEAAEAFKDLQRSTRLYRSKLARIRTYLGLGNGSILQALLRLVDETRNIADDVRLYAIALSEFEDCGVPTPEGRVPFPEIAAAADEAYAIRLEELDSLEAELSENANARVPIVPGSLISHEELAGGHLVAKHVGLTMEDFKDRYLNEGKRILSSFIDRATAEEVVWRAIELNKMSIRRAEHGKKLDIPFVELREIGYVKRRGAAPTMTNAGQLIIFRDVNKPSGYRIYTVKLKERI